MEKCSQCGFFHPPIQVGNECPMKKPKLENGQEIDMSEFVSQLKAIIISNITKKKISDYKRVFSLTLVEIAKFLENYEE